MLESSPENEHLNNTKSNEISHWRVVAKKFGISNSEIEQTKRAFRLAEFGKK
jgi:hypothetical protein